MAGLVVILILGYVHHVGGAIYDAVPVALNKYTTRYQNPTGYRHHLSVPHRRRNRVQHRDDRMPGSSVIELHSSLQRLPVSITTYNRRTPQTEQFFSYPSGANHANVQPRFTSRRSQYNNQNELYSKIPPMNGGARQYTDTRGRVIHLQPYATSRPIQTSLQPSYQKHIQPAHQKNLQPNYFSSNQISNHFKLPWNSPSKFYQQYALETKQLQLNQKYRRQRLQQLQLRRQRELGFHQQQLNRYYQIGNPWTWQNPHLQHQQYTDDYLHGQDMLQQQDQQQDQLQHQLLQQQTNFEIPSTLKTKYLKAREPRHKIGVPQKSHLIQTTVNVLAKYDPQLKPGELVSNIVPSVKYVRGPQHGIIKSYWAYKGDLEHIGPEGWSKLYPTCTGFRQSPMNIIDHNVIYTSELSPFKFTGFDGAKSIFKMHNNGHTGGFRGLGYFPFQPVLHNWFNKGRASISVSDNMKVEGGGLEGEYTTANIHFHWSTDHVGSEHAINGMKFPLEMHVVNYATRYHNLTNAVRYRDGLAVFAVFFTIRRTDNPYFRPIEDGLKRCKFPGSSAQLNPINLQTLIPNANSEYYRYYGSLTTPPCHQSVIWTVFDDIKILSPSQIGHLQNMIESYLHQQNDNDNSGQRMGAKSKQNGPSGSRYPAEGVTHYITDNYRTLQPHNDRVVLTNIKEYAGKTKFAFPNSNTKNSLGTGRGRYENVSGLKAHRQAYEKTHPKTYPRARSSPPAAMKKLTQYVLYY